MKIPIIGKKHKAEQQAEPLDTAEEVELTFEAENLAMPEVRTGKANQDDELPTPEAHETTFVSEDLAFPEVRVGKQA